VISGTVGGVSRSFAFELSSRLAAPAPDVWAHAISMRGVNAELFPLARMTHPPGLESLDGVEAPLARRAFRSWILFAGFLPIDYDDLTFVELGPGRFLERSPMGTQREWQHERRVDPVEGGCLVTDRVRFVPRIAGLGPLFLPVFRMAFALRHRNLRRKFGAAP
jgi:ligand-binding SRPBCC domain-containing protein